MKYRIECEARLAFAAPVREHHGELRLAPRQDDQQKVLALAVSSEPDSPLPSYADCFGNRVHCFGVTPPHEELIVHVSAEIETSLANPFAYTAIAPGRERAWLEREIERQPRLLDFVLHRSPLTPEIDPQAEVFAGVPEWKSDEALLERVMEARDWVASRIELDPSAAAGEDLAAVLAEGRGAAADLAHALVAVVRGWGVPARFVAGYQGIDDEVDAGPAHAWAEVLIPGAGWRGFDAVNGLVVNDRYVSVAVGRDASDTCGLRHVFKGEDADELRSVSLVMSRQDQQ